jgi:hypothetical protein
MTKKIAVLVRGRKHEALRMAVGATLMNDIVHVFVMDEKLENDEETETNLQMLEDLKARVFSNNPENECEQKTIEEIAVMLTDYDVVVPY